MFNIFALIQNEVIVNIVLASPGDPHDANYIWIDITNVVPMPDIGWTYNSGNFVVPITSALRSLNQQYTPAQYGQYLIDQFTTMNTQRNLTSAQLFALAQSLGPFYILLQCGSLQAFLDNMSSIPVDGVVITTDIVNQFQTAIQAYLNGD